MTKIRLLLISLCLVIVNTSLYAKSRFEFTTKEKTYVVGDIHGAYNALVTSMKNMKVVDDNLDWSAGKSHFVSLGDMLDRGPDSRKVMDLFIKLQAQAKKAGGQFHVVLGNHEVMNLKGDLRYVSKAEYQAFEADETEKYREEKYQQFLDVYQVKDSKSIRAQFDEAFPPGYFAYVDAFSLDGKYGEWLTSLPFVIKINEQVFAHGGLSQLVKGMSIAELNELLSETLSRYLKSWTRIEERHDHLFYPPYKERYRLVEKLGKGRENKQFLRAESSLLFSLFGPTWYRGNATCHPMFESDKLKAILSAFGATRLWVGHTTTTSLKPVSRLNDQLIILDTGMLKKYYGGQPHVGIVDNQGVYDLYQGLTKKKIAAIKGAARENANPFGLPDSQMKVVLKNAKVVKRKQISTEAEQTEILTMDYDGHQFYAKFSAIDSAPNMAKLTWKEEYESALRYQNELAAFKLDRILNIGLVPLTIERVIEGKQGIIQVVPENVVSESELMEKYGGQIGFCDRVEQRNLKDVFDYLIQNREARPDNVYYSEDDGQIWFTGYLNSFDPSPRFTAKSRPEEVFVTSAFKQALVSLTKDELQALNQYLHPKQIEGIWLRRERLLGFSED